jgi:hypothetical protein
VVTFFNLAGIALWVSGLASCGMAKGALHESNGLMQCLIGTVFIVGAALIGEVRRAHAPKIPPEQLKGPGDKKPEQNKIPWRNPANPD